MNEHIVTHGHMHSPALSCTHAHTPKYQYTQCCALAQTDRYVPSVAILRLFTGSGLREAKDKLFHHSRRQNGTLHSPLTFFSNCLGLCDYVLVNEYVHVKFLSACC